jgi:hypothetical protein
MTIVALQSSSLKKQYAVGVEFLKANPGFSNDINGLWALVRPTPKISYNDQMDVVIQLWKNE